MNQSVLLTFSETDVAELGGLFEMEIHQSGRVNSAAPFARLLKQAKTGVWATCNPQNWPTVRFSGRAIRRAGEFTPRRQSSAVPVRGKGAIPC